MLALLIVLQVIVAIFLILVVLLQPGNKGGMSAAFGGAGGETVFGGRGANTFLSKLTFGAAAVFMVTSVSLSLMSLPKESVIADKPKESAPTAPSSTPTPSPTPAPATTPSAPADAQPSSETAPEPKAPTQN